MGKYEMVVIIDATLPQEQKEKIVKDVCETATKCEAQVINSHVWIEKQKFSFRMKKRLEGTYYLVNFEAPQAAISKMRGLLRINDDILRSLIINVG